MLSACPEDAATEDGGVSIRSDAGIVILDSGLVAGEGEGEGEDAGSQVPDVMAIEYEGEAEEGTLCGDATCDVGVACCINLDITTFELRGECSTQADPMLCEDAQAQANCDGSEDCNASTLCCLSGDFTNLELMCLEQSACDALEGDKVCINSNECENGQVCCGLDTGVSVPVDLGVCQDSCEG